MVPVHLPRMENVVNVHRVVCAASVACVLLMTPLGADESPLTGPLDFEAFHDMVKRQPGESRWMEIAWYPSVWEARQKAAAEGKPIFLMAGSGGAPAAGC